MDIRKKVSPIRHFISDPDRPTLALLDLGLLAIWIIGAWIQAFAAVIRALIRTGFSTSRRIAHAVRSSRNEMRRSIAQTRQTTQQAILKSAERVSHNVSRSQQAVSHAASTTTNSLASALTSLVSIITAPFRFTGRAIVTTISAVVAITRAIGIGLGYGAHEFSQQLKTIGRDLHASARHRAQRTVHVVRHPSTVIQPPQGWRTTVISFAAVAMIFALPFPAVYAVQQAKKVEKGAMTSAMQGLDAFYAAYDAMTRQDSVEAQNSFALAYAKFEEADAQAHRLSPTLFAIAQRMPIEGKKIASAQAMLNGGKELAIAGQNLARVYGVLTEEHAFKGNILELNEKIAPDLKVAVTHLNNANKLITADTIKALPNEYKEGAVVAQSKLATLSASLQDLSQLSGALSPILGGDIQRRYLIIFQNNAELRPTGGFMGSYAVADVSRGELKKISVPGGGPYDLQGSLREKVIAPQPLHLLNDGVWQFQDANWFPDFPTSAKKIEWFYERSGQSSVDGIIAINASVIEELLKATGPIEMPEYKKTINADNVLKEMQRAVELDYDKKKNKPKKFIADLLPKIMEKMGSGDRAYSMMLLQTLAKAGMQKDIQVYFKDPQAQVIAKTFSLHGAMSDTQGDYLNIVEANIGGGKTDTVISSDLHQKIERAADGSLTETVTLTRTHNGSKGDLFTGGRNTSFVRFYVPKGSTLLTASGFQAPERKEFKNPPEEYKADVDLLAIQGTVYWNEAGMFVNEEFEKTVFSNWMRLLPGETQTITLSYRLPFTVNQGHSNNSYTLFLQKQPGIKNRSYSFEFTSPPGSTIAARYPKTDQQSGSTWEYRQEVLSTDQLIALEIK